MAQRRRANFFAHKARQHSDIETTNTTARPQQGNSETDITSAPENCTKNAHFSPAKAMAVSIPLEHERAKATTVSVKAQPAPAKATTVSVKAQPAPAKATTVSDNRTPGRQGQAPPVWRAPEGSAAVPVGGSRARPGFETTHRATSAHQAPLVWRAPEGPEGTGGLRGAAPNEVRPPSLAGGRALRRPKHLWRPTTATTRRPRRAAHAGTGRGSG